ncbi:WD40 repeat-like protein [Sistotremastrum niveocremeum HHB9708]|uniref:WD40 repeat-like protein n=1 Tax=Sistotremastrum niveocremeum HHB9708 TaxID=1314777 RepID=A0A164YRG0_9AGAM|nr:WD40 repeat-like protein [Sistotremastrum niveocremeum HHB9708]
MVTSIGADSVKVYTVNGAASGSASSLPDWLTRKRAARGKGKRAVREQVEGSIDLIQHFEFPEASNRIRTTRDGRFAVATGVYKPQMRVYDLHQLTMKFERHSDAENVDFVILSDDWTKTLHLQNDRTIEVHNQSGFLYRTRIPRFGRALAYHFPSCDALVSASGSEVYRLNLDQGRFMNSLQLQSDGEAEIEGVNAIDINPAHQLFTFGLSGTGTAQFWDPRSRTRVGVLQLPSSQLLPPMPTAGTDNAFSITSLASRSDGLSLAVGTSTGHTLLYDLRSMAPFATKDQGYGLPVHCLTWIEGGSQMAGDGLVVSADKKVVKIWDRNDASSNFASVTPATDVNHVHHVPGSGMLMLANEGISMTSYYIPQLGPAPKWCSFLDNITEEMEDQTVRNVYEDFKFIEKSELSRMGLDHLIGTPALRPYMHGYFMQLKLYDAARMITNPFAYEEHREKLVKEKMDKLSESRIRARKDGPKINKALAERIRREEEREAKKAERKKARQSNGDEDVEMDAEETPAKEKANLLNDSRFKAMFENPEFQVDESSREFGLLNPSTVASKRKTAVEEEDEEASRASSEDILGEKSDSESDSGSEDSSDAGDLDQYNPRTTAKAPRKAYTPMPPGRKAHQPKMVSLRADTAGGGSGSRRGGKDASFGERRQSFGRKSAGQSKSEVWEGAMETSWVPSSNQQDEEGSGRRPRPKSRNGEKYGGTMEKGGRNDDDQEESLRKGRTKRRTGVRSGSKNVFRQMG